MAGVEPQQIQRILINPIYAVQFAPQLVEEHTPHMIDEEWVNTNALLLKDMGSEKWLTQLLDLLQGNTTAADERISPFHAINIDAMYAVEHPPLISKEQWVQSNAMLMKEMGTKEWLMLFLDVLEGDFVTAEEMSFAPSSTAGHPHFSRGKQKRKKRKKHKR